MEMSCRISSLCADFRTDATGRDFALGLRIQRPQLSVVILVVAPHKDMSYQTTYPQENSQHHRALEPLKSALDVFPGTP